MSGEERPVVSISAIEHFEYCARQCALIHVDQLWADNQHTLAGTRSHGRVDSGEHRQERGRLMLRSIPLWSEDHGLAGRADAIEYFADGTVVPIEYKSGTRHGRTADLQLCAQALCLEEMLGVSIDHGFIWYSASRRRLRVTLTADLRQATLQTVDAIRAQIVTRRLPAAPNDSRCSECQLAPHCLPDVVGLTQPPFEQRVLAELFRCDS